MLELLSIRKGSRDCGHRRRISLSPGRGSVPLSGGCVEQRFQPKLPLAHSVPTWSLTMTTEAVTAKMNEAKQELAELGGIAAKLVRENPWSAVGAAAAAGVILGLLLRGRT